MTTLRRDFCYPPCRLPLINSEHSAPRHPLRCRYEGGAEAVGLADQREKTEPGKFTAIGFLGTTDTF